MVMSSAPGSTADEVKVPANLGGEAGRQMDTAGETVTPLERLAQARHFGDRRGLGHGRQSSEIVCAGSSEATPLPTPGR